MLSPCRPFWWPLAAMIVFVGSGSAMAGPLQGPETVAAPNGPEDTGELLVFFEPGADISGSEHGYKMSACAVPPRANPIGIKVKARGVGAQKADGAFDVFDLRRELPLGRMAIIHAGDQVAAREQLGRVYHAMPIIFVAARPTASMYIYGDGCRLTHRLGVLHIQRERDAVAGAVGDVTLDSAEFSMVER